MQINDYDATKSITTDATESTPGSDTLNATSATTNTTSNTTSATSGTTNTSSTNDDVISTLNTLIETCKDGQNGFQEAAEGVENSNLKSLFYEFSQQRAQFAGELQSLVRELGGDPENSGSMAASLHRGWINIKSVVTGKDDTAILNECERGEDVAKNAYQTAGTSNLPSNVAEVVQKQAEAVRQAHDKVKHLRDVGTGSANSATS
jgi:uncharacterized protein (TIGR02284 family)